MSEFFDYLRTWSVLKWVILVLIAGFIGQFGRMMAESLIRKARLKIGRKKTKPILDSTVRNLESPGQSAGVQADPSLTDRQEPARMDKKVIKALTKERKKAVKTKNRSEGA